MEKNNIEKLQDKISDLTNSEQLKEISIKMQPEVEKLEKEHPEMKKLCAFYVLENTKKHVKINAGIVVLLIMGVFISAKAYIIGMFPIMLGLGLLVWQISTNSKYQKHLIEKYFK